AILRVQLGLQLGEPFDDVLERLDVLLLRRRVVGRLRRGLLDLERAIEWNEVRALDRIEQNRFGHRIHHTNIRIGAGNPDSSLYGRASWPRRATGTPRRPKQCRTPRTTSSALSVASARSSTTMSSCGARSSPSSRPRRRPRAMRQRASTA